MKKRAKNFAFVDSQNVNVNISKLGWKLDWRRFRVYLREKYDVEKAYLFIGLIPGNEKLYCALEKADFVVVFKPTLPSKKNEVKGNCDAELVLQAMIDFKKYDRAVIATSDGDFHCLIQHLLDRKKLECLLVPNRFRYSALLKVAGKKLASMNDLRKKLEYKKMKRTPSRRN